MASDDDNVAFIIGSDRTGRLIELVIRDHDDETVIFHAIPPDPSSPEVMTMRIPDHIDRNDFEALADWVESDDFQIDPGEFRDGAVLRRIAAADEAVERARRELDDEVAAAREAGFSWIHRSRPGHLSSGRPTALQRPSRHSPAGRRYAS